MRVLVTGANGFAGRHLLAELADSGGWEVIGAAPGERSDLERRHVGLAAGWVPLDITSWDSVRAAIRAARPERVYHLAGQASVGDSFRNPELTWEINATGTLRVLEALREEGLGASRLLLISSAEVYGAVPPSEQPIHESRPQRPVTPYGASKAAAEMAALQFALAGVLEVLIARSFNLIGTGQDERFVLPSFARQLAGMGGAPAERVLRVGNLDVRRDFLNVRDGVRGYVAMMEKGESGGIYNVCSGTPTSLRALVERLVELSGTGARVLVDPERVRPVDIPEMTGDPGRLQRLGWGPEVSLDATLAELLNDARERLDAHG